MIRLFFKLFSRNLLSNKVYVLLGMLGLVVGLSGSYILFLWVNHEISFDRFHKDSQLIYRVVSEDYIEGEWVKNVFTPVPLAYVLPERYPGIVAGSSIKRGEEHSFSHGTSTLMASLNFCSEDFFSVFDFPVVEMAGIKFFPHPNSVAVSKAFALRMFGTTNCLNKELIHEFYGKTSYYISAVVDVPENSHMDFDVLVPYSSIGPFGNAKTNWRLSSANYLKMDRRWALDDAEIQEIRGLLQTQSTPNTRLRFQPLHDIYLFTDFTDGFSRKQSSYTTVRLISVIAYALLALSVINYIMLFASRSQARGREMAIKKLLGESRIKLITHYSFEILLVTFVALFLSLVAVSFALPMVNNLSGKSLQLIPGWNLGLYMLITGISVSILSAGYFAIYLSHFSSLNLLRGKSDFSPRFRINTLVAILQLAFAIGFVVFSLSLMAQFNYINSKDRGLGTENIMVTSIMPFGYDYVALKTRLLEHSNIRHVAAGGPPPIDYQFSPVQKIQWEGMELPTDLDVTIMGVDPDYLKTFQMELVEGVFLPEEMSVERHFSRYYADRTPIIINERFKAMMGTEDPIGKSLSMDRFSVKGVITGVVKDFHFRPLSHSIDPLIMFYDPECFTHLYIRIDDEDIVSTMDYISRVADEEKRGGELINTFFLEDVLKTQYRQQFSVNHFVFASTFATICLALMGILGMISYKMVRDQKTITIRKIFGADVMALRFLYIKQTLKIFFAGYVPAIAVSWYATDRWLSAFAYVYHPFLQISLGVLLAGMATIVLLVVLSVNKTCSANPADLIRKL